MAKPADDSSGSSPMDGISAAVAEHYIVTFQLAAGAVSYVTDPARWPGFVAWVEQFPGATIPEGYAEQMRVIMMADARMLLGIAEAGERALKGRG